MSNNVEKNKDETVKTEDELDPVDLATGEFTYDNTLMTLP